MAGNLPLFPPLSLTLRKKLEETVMATENFSNFSSAGEPPSVHGEAIESDREALDRLFNLCYEELRRLASLIKRGDSSVTLNPTALVNEAWIRLAHCPGFRVESPLHFKLIAARAMRRLLIEAARHRHAQKRGNGDAICVNFDEALAIYPPADTELLALDSALMELTRLDPRQAAIVESRFFGGLEIREIASLLEISEATVMRDWRAARAWLSARLSR